MEEKDKIGPFLNHIENLYPDKAEQISKLALAYWFNILNHSSYEELTSKQIRALVRLMYELSVAHAEPELEELEEPQIINISFEDAMNFLSE